MTFDLESGPLLGILTINGGAGTGLSGSSLSMISPSEFFRLKKKIELIS